MASAWDLRSSCTCREVEVLASIARRSDGGSRHPRQNGVLAGITVTVVGQNGLELVYRQFSAIVFEIPAIFEYIDFGGLRDRLQITKIGGYPTGPGMEPGNEGDRMSHDLDVFGDYA